MNEAQLGSAGVAGAPLFPIRRDALPAALLPFLRDHVLPFLPPPPKIRGVSGAELSPEGVYLGALLAPRAVALRATAARDAALAATLSQRPGSATAEGRAVPPQAQADVDAAIALVRQQELQIVERTWRQVSGAPNGQDVPFPPAVAQW